LRWAIGLLRDDFGEVRAYASDILAEAEYTPSIDDMETAYKNEENINVKSVLKKNLLKLKMIISKK
jgi:HEAT repeat protein